MSRCRIKEAIVVEGRDDLIEVAKVYDTLIIPTHGFGIREETWQLIAKAEREKGLIILTDPDYSGEEIRRRITERFPGAKQAWLPRGEAVRGDDIGVENASGEAIRRAVELARVTLAEPLQAPVTADHLRQYGLTGSAGSAERRRAVCDRLGIGYCNGKTFLKRLASFGIGQAELEEALKSPSDREEQTEETQETVQTIEQ